MVRTSPRRRAAAIGLTLAAELLFVLILLGLAPSLPERFKTSPPLVIFDLNPAAPEPKRTVAPKASPRAARQAPVLTPPRPKDVPLPLIPLSKADLAAADISKLGSRAPGAAAGAVASHGLGLAVMNLLCRRRLGIDPSLASLRHLAGSRARPGAQVAP